MTDIPAPHLAFLLLLISFCLGSCLVRVIWQLEQVRARHRQPH